MLYPIETTGSESLMENIHHHESSSSPSSSDHCQQRKKITFFGKQKSFHKNLGGEKCDDIILWRNKQTSACTLAGVTVLWFLFEWIGYNLLSFSCHLLIISMLILFIWSTLCSFLNRSLPKFPDVILPEELFVSMAISLRYELYQAFAIFREIATGKDLKKFLKGIVILWVISVVGTWFNFFTLLYIGFVILQITAVVYEKHKDQVDSWAKKVMVEINKQYTLLEEKVRHKLANKWPPFDNKDKKQS